MLRFVKETYKTYHNTRTNQCEGHKLRVFLLVLLTVFICGFSDGSSSDLNNMMITGLTILTGFTFTALFSDHSLADIGLPKPANETDRYDLERLNVLANNFHVRSRYFIVLSIVDVCILIARSINFSLPSIAYDGLGKISYYLDIDVTNIIYVATTLKNSISLVVMFITIFLFFECLYTFYRLSETIISIVNTRRSYLKATR